MLKQRKLWMIFLPWFTWFIAVTFYAHQFLLRVSVSSLAPGLSKSFHISALSLANVAAFFYYAFMVMQIISGILIDKFGPKLMLTLAAVIVSVGSMIFSHSHSIMMLEISRVFIGGGAAFALIGTLTLARNWFNKKQFIIINGLTIAIGTFGAFVGVGPLAELLSELSWRKIIFYVSLLGLIHAVLIFIIIQDSPKTTTKTKQKNRGEKFFTSLKSVFVNKQIWLCGLFAGFIYVPVNAFAALWCAQFLVANHIPVALASTASSMIFVGLCLGSPLMAFVANRFQHITTIIKLSSLICIGLMCIVLYYPIQHVVFYFIYLFFIGIFVSSFSLSFIIVRSHSDQTNSATAFSLNNLLKLLAGTLLLEIIGLVLESHHAIHGTAHQVYKLSDFHFALSVLPISLILSFILIFFVRNPSPEML